MRHILTCNNFIVLLVEKCNGRLWYLVLFYGAPSFHLRQPVLDDLEECLSTLVHPFLILGDFNQVEFGSDKLSLNTRSISGAVEFNHWKINNQLVDIPFKGPRFTWCNNRKGSKRVYERLDRALGSKDWLMLFPETGIKHYPIQISDHAPIELDLHLTRNKSNKPYKVDAWVLEYDECICIIQDVWKRHVRGSPAFKVARILSMVRQEVRHWALDKTLEWHQKWDNFDLELEKGMDAAINDGDDAVYTRANDNVREFAKAAAVFWRQRVKLKWMIEGDTCTKYFFNWVKGRAGRNFILGIKNGNESWIYEPDLDGDMFHESFYNLFNPPNDTDEDYIGSL
ncbi:uncharacterized protein LOC141616929 [Silene latifolia]|uniref:uncharacterized protein LOC141616929 n=1 Tax=Silene latifolia TaxID=37657 RepID=UPI003D7877F2